MLANRRYWDEQAPNRVAAGERPWADTEPRWGNWNLPDAGIELLPADMTGSST